MTSTTTTTTTAGCIQLAHDNSPFSTSFLSKPPALCSITASTKKPLVTSLSIEEDQSDDEEDEDNIDESESVNGVTFTSSPLLPSLVQHQHRNAAVSHLSSPDSKFPTVLGAPLPPPLSTAVSSATKMALDKNPLWLQNPAVSSNSPDAKKPVLIPLSNRISLAGSPIAGMGGADKIPTTTPVHPSLMYQLMSPHPLLGPMLTVLPSTSNLMSQQPMFLASPIGPAGQKLMLQSAIVKQPQPTQILVEQTHAELAAPKNEIVPRIIAEPTTGQTFTVSPDYSPVNATFNPGPRTLASISPSELTPQHLELKSFAEEFKTRRIRLGFTQGSVGQSLAERGYNNFAQSTISRFEQMQLSPANAATIRVILEKWLLEAECPESVSSASNNLPQMASRKRKKRAVFTPQTKSILDDFFTQNPRPNRQAIENISQKLDILPEEVRVWFCNKRQKSKSSCSSYHRMSFDRESTSSGVPSPTMSEGGMSQRRHTPSPPKTPFTIEELSKSSCNSTLISSPIKTCSASMFPMGLVASITQSTRLPILFNSPTQGARMFSNPLLSQSSQIAQTRA